ncbi:MAG: LysE family transporter [Dehalococcoidales bacterium]|nr:LysE family transporter [Dehalococcoidales bacterium]
MLPVLLSVVVISLSGVMAPGPMFAVVLTKSFRSPWAGTMISLGHAVIEIPLILLIYFGFTQIFENIVVQFILCLIGGGMLIWLGVDMFRSRKEIVSQGKDLTYSAFTAGIITTGLNPFFILWWATVGALLLMKFMAFWEVVAIGLAVFIIIHWMCDLIWLTFVSVTVNKTHHLWGTKIQELVFIAAGLLLAGFGIWFIVSGIQSVV